MSFWMSAPFNPAVLFRLMIIYTVSISHLFKKPTKKEDWQIVFADPQDSYSFHYHNIKLSMSDAIFIPARLSLLVFAIVAEYR